MSKCDRDRQEPAEWRFKVTALFMLLWIPVGYEQGIAPFDLPPWLEYAPQAVAALGLFFAWPIVWRAYRSWIRMTLGRGGTGANPIRAFSNAWVAALAVLRPFFKRHPAYRVAYAALAIGDIPAPLVGMVVQLLTWNNA